MQSADPALGGRLSQRFAEQNQARIGALDTIARDKTALTAAGAERKALISPLYEKAFQDFQAIPKALAPAVDDVIGRLDGTSILAKAKQLAKLEGIDIDPKQSLRGLHYVKLAIDDSLDRAFEGGLGKTEQRALVMVRDDLVKAMEKMSPMYELARGSFAQASAPMKQMETLQDIRANVMNPGTTVSGENMLSQAKWFSQVTKKADELGKTLSKGQMDVLERIGKDLDRGALSQSAGKAAGSNTFQNLSAANVVGAVLGGKAASSPTLLTLTRPLSFLYKLPDQAVQHLMFEAMLDKNLAMRLMSKASEQQLNNVGSALHRKAVALGYGSLLGATQGIEDR